MTTIIYDQTGRIIMTQSGDMGATDADVLTYDVPDGYRAVSVNPVTKEVTLEEIPKTAMETELESLKAQQTATNEAVLGLMNMLMNQQ